MFCECGHLQGYHRFRIDTRLGACMTQHCTCQHFREEYTPPYLASETPPVTGPPSLVPLEDVFTPPEPAPAEPVFEAGGGTTGGGGAGGSYDAPSSTDSDSGSSSSDASSGSDSGSPGSSD